MQFKDEDGVLRAVVLQDQAGGLVWAGLGNDKAWKKSLEQGSLWALDGATGRLLPLAELRPDLVSQARLAGIKVEGDRIVAVSAARGAPQPAVAAGTSQPDTLAGGVGGSGGQAGAGGQGGAIPTPAGAAANDSAGYAVLGHLEELIRRRKAELPEGSYTTHLFKSGLHKIRKKTGEEAVELVLAKDQAEVTAEAADLIYHMIVLLVEWGVPLDAVMDELRRR